MTEETNTVPEDNPVLPTFFLRGRCGKCGGAASVIVSSSEIQSINGYINQAKRRIHRGHQAGRPRKASSVAMQPRPDECQESSQRETEMGEQQIALE